MKPVIYLAVAYENDNGEIAIVFSDTDMDCSFITLRGAEVVKQGELGKADMLKLHNNSELFTDHKGSLTSEDTN